MLWGIPEGLVWGSRLLALDSSYKPALSADEVDTQRKEAIKAKVNESPLRKWVRDPRASGDWLLEEPLSLGRGSGQPQLTSDITVWGGP